MSDTAYESVRFVNTIVCRVRTNIQQQRALYRRQPVDDAHPGHAQTTFTYDARYNRTATNYPNGVSLYMTYDGSSRLTSIQTKKVAAGTVLASFTYSYAAGASDTALRQSVTDKDGNLTVYSYDVLDRLTEARTTAPGGAQLSDYQYAYDGNGNRTSQTVNGTTTSYTYNAANELTNPGYTFDANGNQTASPSTAFTYNAKEQTTAAVEFPRFRGHLSAWPVWAKLEDGVHVQAKGVSQAVSGRVSS